MSIESIKNSILFCKTFPFPVYFYVEGLYYSLFTLVCQKYFNIYYRKRRRKGKIL